MTATITNNPWETAEQAKEPTFSSVIWGQCEAASWFCVLEKGVGKIEFDPNIHSPEQRRTAIDITIRALPEMVLTFDLTRSMVAESREWASFTLPSIRDLGFSPKQLNGAWVKVQTVPLTDKAGNPVTYTDSNGAVKEKTAIKFMAIFKDEAECRADYLANSGNPPQQNTQYPGTGGGNGNASKERETAYQFLKVYVKNACQGQTDIEAVRAKLAPMLAQQPVISKYFTVDSPEVMELMAEYMERIPF